MQYSAILRALWSLSAASLSRRALISDEIFAPEPNHQVGRRPPDIAVVVGHRLAQRIRGIHRKCARTDLRERIRGSPSHATIRACDRRAKFFSDDRIAGRGHRDEFIDRSALNGFARIA